MRLGSDQQRAIYFLVVKDVSTKEMFEVGNGPRKVVAYDLGVKATMLRHLGEIATVTSTSGRGVGLDVVREEIVRLKATIEIVSERGRGTRFIMKLPLTLSITEALLTACGDDVFAIPIDSIVETTRLDLDVIESVDQIRN